MLIRRSIEQFSICMLLNAVGGSEIYSVHRTYDAVGGVPGFTCINDSCSKERTDIIRVGGMDHNPLSRVYCSIAHNKILTVNMSQTNEHNLVFIGFTLTQFDMLNNWFGYCYPRTRKIIRSHNSRINLNSHKKQNNIIVTITTPVWTTQQLATPDTNTSDLVPVSLSLLEANSLQDRRRSQLATSYVGATIISREWESWRSVVLFRSDRRSWLFGEKCFFIFFVFKDLEDDVWGPTRTNPSFLALSRSWRGNAWLLSSFLASPMIGFVFHGDIIRISVSWVRNCLCSLFLDNNISVDWIGSINSRCISVIGDHFLMILSILDKIKLIVSFSSKELYQWIYLSLSSNKSGISTI